MTTTAFNQVNSQSSRAIYPEAPSKALRSFADTSKNNRASNTELSIWYEQALTYYSAVISGQEPQPDPAAWNQFLEYKQWAEQEMGMGGQWDPMAGGVYDGSEYGPPAEALPPGAKLGLQNNIVFNHGKDETLYSPSQRPIDVLSDEFILNVDVKVRSINVEKTKDSRVQPPVDAIKITINDPTANPSETVYYVDTDTKITINSVGGKGVTQHGTENLRLGDGTPQITVGSFSSEEIAATASNQASVEGAKNEENSRIEYEASASTETIFFAFEDGETEYHVSWGNADVALKPSDTAAVIKQNDGSSLVVIQHRDGSFDTLEVKPGFTLTIHGMRHQVNNGNDVELEGVTVDYGTTEPSAEAPAEVPESAQNLAGAGIDMTAEEIAAAAEGLVDLETPPAVPNSSVYEFLVKIDPELRNLLEGYRTGSAETRRFLNDQIRDRLVTLLSAMYGSRVSFDLATGEDDDGDNIKVGDTVVDVLRSPGDRSIDEISSDQLWKILQFEIQE